jgi:hypothetical protein
MKTYTLYKSTNALKKYDVFVVYNDRIKKVSFGATGYSDYTKHKDPERKQRYVTRHKSREKWTKNGIATPGFWSRWVLWNKPSLRDSLNDTLKRFNLKPQVIH